MLLLLVASERMTMVFGWVTKDKAHGLLGEEEALREGVDLVPRDGDLNVASTNVGQDGDFID